MFFKHFDLSFIFFFFDRDRKIFENVFEKTKTIQKVFSNEKFIYRTRNVHLSRCEIRIALIDQ